MKLQNNVGKADNDRQAGVDEPKEWRTRGRRQRQQRYRAEIQAKKKTVKSLEAEDKEFLLLKEYRCNQ